MNKQQDEPENPKPQKTTTKQIPIKLIKTTKDQIKQPDLAKDDNMYIPPIGSSVVISGKSGCGKSTLLANFLTQKGFYHGYFQKVFLFSPTANGDDIQKSLNIPKENVFTDLDEAEEILEVIIENRQRALDEAKSAADVEQWAILFDDVIGHLKFMNSKAFMKCFYQVRHLNLTTFALAQHFKKIPRVCRLQANFIYFFEGSLSEVETVADEFAPPMMHTKNFMQLVVDATKEDFSFLTINLKHPFKTRFRKGLYEIMDLNSYGLSSNINNVSRPINNNVGNKTQQNNQIGGKYQGYVQSSRSGGSDFGGQIGKNSYQPQHGRDGDREEDDRHRKKAKIGC